MQCCNLCLDVSQSFYETALLVFSVYPTCHSGLRFNSMKGWTESQIWVGQFPLYQKSPFSFPKGWGCVSGPNHSTWLFSLRWGPSWISQEFLVS
jgi:hypothetical protein